MYFLDTSFLIDIIRGKVEAVKLLKKLDPNNPLITSAINVHEFLVGAHGSQNTEGELSARKKVLNKLFIVPFDEMSAEKSAEIEARLRTMGDLIGTADILIAGVMITNGISKIVTNNKKHFSRVEGLEVISY